MKNKLTVGQKAYVTPELKQWGTVRDLTQVGNNSSVSDVFQGNAHTVGSSIPSGQAKK